MVDNTTEAVLAYVPASYSVFDRSFTFTIAKAYPERSVNKKHPSSVRFWSRLHEAR